MTAMLRISSATHRSDFEVPLDDSPESCAIRLDAIPHFPKDHVAVVHAFHDGFGARCLLAEPSGSPELEEAKADEEKGICVYFIDASGRLLYKTDPCAGGWTRRPERCGT